MLVVGASALFPRLQTGMRPATARCYRAALMSPVASPRSLLVIAQKALKRSLHTPGRHPLPGARLLILFYGRGDDPPLQKAIETARELEQDLIWLDQCALDRADLLVSVTDHGATGVLTIDGRSVELDAISGNLRSAA